MTRTEVETILGPPGFHATGKLAPVGTLIPVPGRIDTKDEFWQGDTIIIYLYFDSSGSVVDKDYREVRRVPQGLIDSFRFRLEQQKRQRDYLEEDSPPQQAGGSKR